jgi:hypothetical protein
MKKTILNIKSTNENSMRREAIAVIVTVAFFCIIIIIAFSGNLITLDYWTAVAASLTIATLGVLYWGFKRRISTFVKGSNAPQLGKIETPKVNGFVKNEEGANKSEDLSDEEFKILCANDRIVNLLTAPNVPMKLSISNDFLDELYDQARNQAVNIHHDAKLLCFTIQVFPFQILGSRVNIYFTFYSKTADKVSKFALDETIGRIEHSPPIRARKKDFPNDVFTKLPWRKSPNWQDFLDRVYELENPIHEASGSNYHLRAVPYNNKYAWSLEYVDFSGGDDFSYEWTGKGIDSKNIRKLTY